MNLAEVPNKAYEVFVMQHSKLITQPPLPNLKLGHNYAMGITGAILTGTFFGVIGHGIGGLISFIREQQLKGPIIWNSDTGHTSSAENKARSNIERNELYRTVGATIGAIAGVLVGGYIGLNLK